MISDVTSWLSNPSQNFGWIMIGNEATSATAYQFHSRENPGFPPVLTISYTTPSCMTDLTVSGNIGSGFNQASNIITISGSVATNAVATFKGGNSVQLSNNSEILNGANVEFLIGPCN